MPSSDPPIRVVQSQMRQPGQGRLRRGNRYLRSESAGRLWLAELLASMDTLPP